MLTRAVLLPLAALGLLLTAAPSAGATTTADDRIVEEVLSDGVYVDRDFGVDVDEAALEQSVARAPLPLFVVLLPDSDVPAEPEAARSLTAAVGNASGEVDAAVLLITDAPYSYVLEGPETRLDAVAALDQARRGLTPGQIDASAVSRLVGSFVDRLDAQADGGSGSGSGSSSGGSVLPWLLGLGVLGGGAYALTRSRRSRAVHAQSMQDARADVESLYARLGSDVQTLAPGDDAVARQALADASERYNATGALMSRADSEGEWAAARRTAVEGLTAARVVRQRLGLDPGPEIPAPVESEAPVLEQAGRVQVGDEQYEGSPQYAPGRPYYYEGGYYGQTLVPGGWYATPFWQSMVLSSVLGGGRRTRYAGGGLLGGGAVRRPVSRRSGWSGGGGWGGGRGGGGWGGGGRRGGGGW